MKLASQLQNPTTPVENADYSKIIAIQVLILFFIALYYMLFISSATLLSFFSTDKYAAHYFNEMKWLLAVGVKLSLSLFVIGIIMGLGRKS